MLHSRTLAVLFALKLRRLARLRRDLRNLNELSDAPQTGYAQLLRAPTAKRLVLSSRSGHLGDEAVNRFGFWLIGKSQLVANS